MNNITVVSDAIHNDFFSVASSELPMDCIFEFSSSLGTVTLTPDFVRPHIALLERLPSSLPVGMVSLRLTSPSTTPSDSVEVKILATKPQTVRVLQPGAAKAHPYTIVFIANPAIESAAGGVFSVDPVLTDWNRYQAIVMHSFRNLFGVEEDLLRRDGIDAQMRIVTIFDPTRPVDGANSLAQEVPASNIMETRRTALVPLLAHFKLEADMVFVVHGSSTHTRASAWFTTDDPTRSATSFTFDGVTRKHGHFPRIPGSAAIPTTLDVSGLTVLHEFGHAASDFNHGKVTDLYDDGGDGTGFLVNKKLRASAATPVPANFGIYEGTTFTADQNRDGLSYPANWRSYHAEPQDTTRPNLMDNYWLAFDDPQLCRLDRLTYAWFRDRLDAKLDR